MIHARLRPQRVDHLRPWGARGRLERRLRRGRALPGGSWRADVAQRVGREAERVTARPRVGGLPQDVPRVHLQVGLQLPEACDVRSHREQLARQVARPDLGLWEAERERRPRDGRGKGAFKVIGDELKVAPLRAGTATTQHVVHVGVRG